MDEIDNGSKCAHFPRKCRHFRKHKFYPLICCDFPKECSHDGEHHLSREFEGGIFNRNCSFWPKPCPHYAQHDDDIDEEVVPANKRCSHFPRKCLHRIKHKLYPLICSDFPRECTHNGNHTIPEEYANGSWLTHCRDWPKPCQHEWQHDAEDYFYSDEEEEEEDIQSEEEEGEQYQTIGNFVEVQSSDSEGKLEEGEEVAEEESESILKELLNMENDADEEVKPQTLASPKNPPKIASPNNPPVSQARVTSSTDSEQIVPLRPTPIKAHVNVLPSSQETTTPVVTHKSPSNKRNTVVVTAVDAEGLLEVIRTHQKGFSTQHFSPGKAARAITFGDDEVAAKKPMFEADRPRGGNQRPRDIVCKLCKEFSCWVICPKCKSMQNVPQETTGWEELSSILRPQMKLNNWEDNLRDRPITCSCKSRWGCSPGEGAGIKRVKRAPNLRVKDFYYDTEEAEIYLRDSKFEQAHVLWSQPDAAGSGERGFIRFADRESRKETLLYRLLTPTQEALRMLSCYLKRIHKTAEPAKTIRAYFNLEFCHGVSFDLESAEPNFGGHCKVGDKWRQFSMELPVFYVADAKHRDATIAGISKFVRCHKLALKGADFRRHLARGEEDDNEVIGVFVTIIEDLVLRFYKRKGFFCPRRWLAVMDTRFTAGWKQFF